MALAGVLVAGGALWASYRPPLYAATSFWTSSPTYYGIRIGVMTLLLGAARGGLRLQRTWPAALGALAKIGRNSLFIYWIHVEMVYGYLSWGIHRRLPLLLTLVAYAAFCAALYLLVDFKARLVQAGRAQFERWRAATAVAA